jgi:glyoxylase-like metal-dependent hydrolase (beta-lactamase superfamily II)
MSVPLDVREVGDGVHHAVSSHVTWSLIVDGDAVTLVDCGYPGERERVEESLRAIGRTLADVEVLLLTHGHADHLGSAEALRRDEGIAVHTHEHERASATGVAVQQLTPLALLPHLWKPRVLAWSLAIARLGGGREERLQEVATFSGGSLDVPGQPVAVHTPGHTDGHCSFHLPERGVLLAGDALATAHHVTRMRGPHMLPAFFHADVDQAWTSLDHLARLDAEVVVPGHGPAFRGTPAAAVEAVRAHANRSR